MNPPRIALVHATPLAVQPVQDAFARGWPAALRMNLLDDSLSADLARDGRLGPAMVRRFEALALYARDCGCDALLFTCSAFGPAIDAAARVCGLPTLRPNEAMFDEARVLDRPAALVASFEPSIASMRAEYEALQPTSALHTRFVPGAMQALADGDAAAHDAAIADAVATLPPEVEVVMLAQFSMARAVTVAQARTRARVLTSPDCAVAALRARLRSDG